MEACQDEGTRRFDAFDTRMVALTDQDIGGLHNLTVAVNWPHRPEDIRLLLEVGQGFLICDPIDRALASGFYFPMGPDFATIGMMLTVPRLQTLGAGSWMLERVLEKSGAKGFLLNSTRQGYSLYERAGFRPIQEIHQIQGHAKAPGLPSAPAGVEFLDLTAEDHAAVKELDARAFGADRSVILDRLFPLSSSRAAVRDGQIIGYAMMRNFGRGKVIGPIVCDSEDAAIALITPFVQQAKGQYLRVDVPIENNRLAAFVSSAGLKVYDTVIEMQRGQSLPRNASAKVMGLAAHAWG
jgi:GNAT superfamily N-acetyltransferase